MSKEDRDRPVEQARAAYEPPEALRLDGAREGKGGTPEGQCRGPGSGAVSDCFTGVSAQGYCVAPGSGAVTCGGQGSQPASIPGNEH